MRLINTATIELSEFFDKHIPPYAILSHTWGEDEVTFKDIRKGTGESKEGYKKILYTCAQAKEDGLEWAWCDTCCIDKKSSSELSEAINSMFRWYQNASVAYAYLADVLIDVSAGEEAWHETFVQSRWHTRGWTLQELLAPSNLIFYSADWQKLGAKKDMSEILTEATGIHVEAIKGSQDFTLANGHVHTSQRPISYFSIAQRMSWASRRQTTRVEDIAYSLMGIFEINMALLYGEGDKAFIRLQEEIMRNSDDQSLFAWRCSKALGRETCGLLALAPENFAESASIVGRGTDEVHFPPRHAFFDLVKTTTHMKTSRGIELDLQLQDPCSGITQRSSVYIALLACHMSGGPITRKEPHGIAICLRRDGHLYWRINSAWLLLFPFQTSMWHFIRAPQRAGKQAKSKYSSWTVAPHRTCVTTRPSSFAHTSSGSWLSNLHLVTVNILGVAGFYVCDMWPAQCTSYVHFVLPTMTAATIIFRRSSSKGSYLSLRPCNYVCLFLLGRDRAPPLCHLRALRPDGLFKRSKTSDLRDFTLREQRNWLKDGHQPTTELDLGSTSPGKMVTEISPMIPEHREFQVYNLVVRTKDT
jgi:hypothetical protein